MGEVGSDHFCLLREDLVLKNPEQVSVQGPPRLKAGSGKGWKPFHPEPLPPSRKAPLVSVRSTAFLLGGGGAWLKRNLQLPS